MPEIRRKQIDEKPWLTRVFVPGRDQAGRRVSGVRTDTVTAAVRTLTQRGDAATKNRRRGAKDAEVSQRKTTLGPKVEKAN